MIESKWFGYLTEVNDFISEKGLKREDILNLETDFEDRDKQFYGLFYWKENSINVNGRNCYWDKSKISYSDIIRLAQKEYSDYYTVTFCDSYMKHGILTHKDEIEVKDGMVFNIFMTGNA